MLVFFDVLLLLSKTFGVLILNPSFESVVGQVVSGCVGFDSVLLLTKKIDQNFFALLN